MNLMIKIRGHSCPHSPLDVEFVVLDTFDKCGPFVIGKENGIFCLVVAVANGNTVGRDSHSDASLGIVLGPRRCPEVLIPDFNVLEHFFSFPQSFLITH